MNKKLLCAALLCGMGVAHTAVAQEFDDRWYVSASTGVNSAAKAAKALSGSSETTATELCDSRKFSILARDMPPQASAATAYHAPPGASAVNATALSAK